LENWRAIDTKPAFFVFMVLISVTL